MKIPNLLQQGTVIWCIRKTLTQLRAMQYGVIVSRFAGKRLFPSLKSPQRQALLHGFFTAITLDTHCM